MTTADRITPELHLDPDGRPLVVIDLEDTPCDLTVWGMVCAQSVDGVATALVCTDTGDPPTATDLRALADALDDSPEKPGSIVGSRMWEKARADVAVTELAGARADTDRYARARAHLEQERDEARAHAARAWQQLNEESARNDEDAEFTRTLRGRYATAERALAEAREHTEALRAQLDEARGEMTRIRGGVLAWAVTAMTAPRKNRRTRSTR